jgi:hypothetical protein
MQPVPTPFLVSSSENKDGKPYGWPESLDVMLQGKKASFKRYVSGSAVSEEGMFIPVDPGTQNLVCPADVLIRIRRELNDMEEVLRGNPTPGEERVGLLETGKRLLGKLKDIGKTAP